MDRNKMAAKEYGQELNELKERIKEVGN